MQGNNTDGDSIPRFIRIFGSYLVTISTILVFVAGYIGQISQSTSWVATLVGVALIIALILLSNARIQGIIELLRNDVSLLRDAVLWPREHPILTAIFIVIGLATIVYSRQSPDNAAAAQAAAAGLAVVALIIALVQLSDARKQGEVLGTHTDRLQTISRRMSTQYEGEFPRFLPRITELISEADKELTIFCDFPAYGALSGGKDFREYKEAIERKKGKMKEKLRFVYLEAKERKGVLDRQFNADDTEERGWNDWKKELGKKELLESFFKEHGPEDVKGLIERYPPELSEGERIPEDISKESILASHISFKAFKECFDLYNVQVLDETFGGDVARKETPHRMPIYFWICDDRKAVFTLLGGLSGREKEFGFYTTDYRFIAAFKSLFHSYRVGIGTKSAIAVCFKKGYKAFKVGKLYSIVRDESAEHGYSHVVDESGQKHAFSTSHFHPVELPLTVEQELSLSPSRV